LDQSKDWIICVSLETCTCIVWRNILSRICRSIGRHFKCSINTLIKKRHFIVLESLHCMYLCVSCYVPTQKDRTTEKRRRTVGTSWESSCVSCALQLSKWSQLMLKGNSFKLKLYPRGFDSFLLDASCLTFCSSCKQLFLKWGICLLWLLVYQHVMPTGIFMSSQSRKLTCIEERNKDFCKHLTSGHDKLF